MELRSEPRSSRFRPGIRTCDCPFSSPLRSRHGCSRWYQASWSGCATIDTIELYERNMIDELALRLVHGSYR